VRGYRPDPVAGLEIHPLSELRSEAAGLLGERFARQRAAEPLLPEVEDFEPYLPEAGHVATRGGEAVAYLGGTVDEEYRIARWPFAGHAAREPEALRDLFALQAGELGLSRFMLTVPSSAPELVDAWFRLGFGCQAVWAVREPEPLPPVDFGGEIRRATEDDLGVGLDLFGELVDHQARTPSFSDFRVQPREELEAEALEDFRKEIFVELVAERDGRIVGWLSLYDRPEGDLRVPAGNIDLSFAATLPDVRGDGVGLALTHHALAYAAEHGFRSITVDWRSVNLLSSRFWPKRGFRPTYLRLYRAVP